MPKSESQERKLMMAKIKGLQPSVAGFGTKIQGASNKAIFKKFQKRLDDVIKMTEMDCGKGAK